MDNLRMTSLDIEITTRCNLNCSYCYLHGVRDRKDMSDETILKVVDFIEKMRTPQDKPFPIRFYGGEPMLRFEKVRKLVDEVKRRKIFSRFVIFSNGVVGTQEDADYCIANKIQLVRGCNGTKEAQEAERPNTYDKYQAMTKLFHDEKGHRRMTTTPANVKWMARGVRELVEAGAFGATPMPDYYANWSEEATKEYCDQMREVGKFYVERFKMGKPFYTYFISKESACRFTGRTSIVYCAAGKGLHCVNIDGYLFVCHRFITEAKDSDFCFGHIDEIMAGTAKGYGQVIKDAPKLCDAKQKSEKCKACKGRASCELACIHANYKFSGRVDEPNPFYCVFHEAVADIVTEIDKELRPIDPEWWTKANIRGEVKSYLKRRNQTHKPMEGYHTVVIPSQIDGVTV